MARSVVNKTFTNIIPKEIDSAVKITKHMTMKSLIFIVGSYIIMEQFGGIVHPNIRFIYTIVCFLISLCLIIPVQANPGKQLYNAIMFSIIKDNTVYHPIEICEVDDE